MSTGNNLDFRAEGLRRLSPIALAVMLLLGLSPAIANASDFQKFGLSLGVFITDRASDARLSGNTANSGTDVDLESDLGLDKSDSVFRVDGYYRFNEKHRIDFSIFDLSRSASKRIERDIEWDGEIYPVDTQIDANFDFNVYKLAYTWSFLRREWGYLGLTGGLYVADIGAGISASSIGQASTNGVTAPLPVLGLRGQYDFGKDKKWSLRGSAEIFALEYGDFSGSFYDIYAGLDYQLFKNMAIGAGWNSVNLNVGIDKTNFNGDLDWRYDGGLLFARFSF